MVDLADLAYNLRWAWRPSCVALFEEISPSLWHANGNPVAFLFLGDRLAELAKDAAFVAKVQKEAGALRDYLSTENEAWWGRNHAASNRLVAYFCAEYGLHESFNIYSGGLGILAGDHCKEASDLGMPFIPVGLFYRHGFFRQMIDQDGRQEHLYPTLLSDRLPLRPVKDPMGERQLVVKVPLPGREVNVAAWRVDVGRVPLILLDTDLPENSPQDRPITSQLYTSGRDMRLHQEIVLGVGGVRVLEALAISPTVWHLNEGHSAFLLLERLRGLITKGAKQDKAAEQVKSTSILTIHTPVAAGNERFDAGHAAKTLSVLLADTGLKPAEFLKLGLDSVKTPGVFDLTAFAIRHTRLANGVSLLHGRTADKTWSKTAGKHLIGVTNGVHMPTWLGPEISQVLNKAGASFDRETQLGVDESLPRPEFAAIMDVPARDLWEAHLRQKEALIEFARQRMFEQHARHGDGPEGLAHCLEALNPNALLIGFARRFATYKRAHLLFSDEKLLAKLLNDSERPVQIVFAGKAHPADRAGQKLIAEIHKKTQSPKFRGKVFLLEEYDMRLGRALVQGVDVWLNNPRRPLEASGTSGMKAAANGVPNLSVLDGWWDEAYHVTQASRNGWAIGGRKTVADEKAQDKADAAALFKALTDEVIPAYYRQDADGVPREWVKIMKRSIADSLYAFSTARMLRDYVQDMY